jgi:LuxR family maltose regulon positive regulatory protein
LPFPILETKLYIPRPVRDSINRGFLVEKLETELKAGIPLILLSAPAGYGKTSLLSEWINNKVLGDVHFVWISLDAADNDPLRFLTYLGVALNQILPGIEAWMDHLLAAPTLPNANEIITVLINQLNSIQKSVVLVLDDFHVIKDPIIHSAMDFFVDHLPSHVHLVISSRSDPPIKLHRLRARGQVGEFRMQDFRFSNTEIDLLLRKNTQIDYSSDDIRLLATKTEGWIAGIRMALLSLQGNKNLSELLDQISGQHRYIMDFLSEEAFNNQNESIKEFLLETAPLDRFCAPLCDSIRGKDDSMDLLRQLEISNCFLIPLDENRIWYRYHHLFSDLLQIRLKQSVNQNSGHVQQIQRNAAEWFEQNHYDTEAIQFFIQSGDFTHAAEIVETSTIDLFSRGRLHQLLSWIRLLPDELRTQRPGLNIYQAWTLAFASRLQDSIIRLEQADLLIDQGEYFPIEISRFKAEIQAIRSLIAVTSGNIPEAMQLLDLPDDIVPKEFKFARSVQVWSVGYAYRIKGDLDKAEHCFREALELGYSLDNVYTIVSTSVDLGEILRQKGNLNQAESVFRTALKKAYQTTPAPGFVGRLESFLANLLIEKHQFTEAESLIEQAIRHNQEWENLNHGAYAWLIKAKYFYALRDYPKADQAMQEVQTWVNKGPIVSTLRNSINLMWINLWLVSGEKEKTRQWLSNEIELLNQYQKNINESSEVQLMSAIKIFIAEGDLLDANQYASSVEKNARKRNRHAILIQVLVLTALLETDKKKAQEALKDALLLGLPAGFRQVYLEYGKELLPLLEECQKITGVNEILSILYQERTNQINNLLTSRELQILGWMATGMSNIDIGEKLFISAGTVKAHSASIYRKLQVSNRTEAIAKAKDLELV